MGQVGQAIENDLLKGLKGQGIERRWRWLCWWALMNAIMASELWISWVVWSSCSAHAIFNNQDNDRLWHCPSFATRGWWFSVCNAMIRCICCKQITINPSAKTRGRNLRLSAQSASSVFYFLLAALAGSFWNDRGVWPFRLFSHTTNPNMPYGIRKTPV